VGSPNPPQSRSGAVLPKFPLKEILIAISKRRGLYHFKSVVLFEHRKRA